MESCLNPFVSSSFCARPHGLELPRFAVAGAVILERDGSSGNADISLRTEVQFTAAQIGALSLKNVLGGCLTVSGDPVIKLTKGSTYVTPSVQTARIAVGSYYVVRTAWDRELPPAPSLKKRGGEERRITPPLPAAASPAASPPRAR